MTMRATGRGTELEPVIPLNSWIVISKPAFSVSTKEVYRGIDEMEITARPDNDELVRQFEESAASMQTSAARQYRPFAKPTREMYANFVNVLEEYTLKAYPDVASLKSRMTEAGAKFSLMSGSGPTVFGIFGSLNAAKTATSSLRKQGIEAYWTKTTL